MKRKFLILFINTKDTIIKPHKLRMEKKTYSRPVLLAEHFVPQEYCETCFTYEATLRCAYGAVYPSTTGGPEGHGCFEANGAQHGAPCANSFIKVTITNGEVTYVGHEGADKPDVPLESVVIPGITTLQQGDHITGATWTSANGDYHHQGNGTVTSWVLTKPGHPNHS